MATASYAETVDNTEDHEIFNAASDNGAASRVEIGVRSSSASTMLVRIVPLHNEEEYVEIQKGASMSFETSGLNITQVFAKGSDGTATYDFAVTRK
jgi:prolyl oligopeptidase PreP (S9A serine peptidase family)